MRLAFASFGIILHILSVAISVFMLGLSMVSWLVGEALLYLKKKTKRSALLFYMLAEVVIGVSSQPNVYRLR
jgi:hypothetical protein